MLKEVTEIVSDKVMLEFVLETEKLHKYTKKLEQPQVESFPWNQLRHLHILPQDRRLNTESGLYLDDSGTWLLAVGLQEDEINRYIHFCSDCLEILDIRFTAIHHLDVSHLTGVKRLILAQNSNLCSVTGIHQLANLQELNLMDSPVSQELDLNGHHDLRKIQLGGTEIHRIKLGHPLGHVEELYIWRTPISEIGFVEMLPSLRRFSLIGSAVTSLDDICLPLGIEHLLLGKTGIRRIPGRIRSMKKLKELYLAELELDELPDWLPELGLKLHDSYADGICLRDAKIKDVDMSIFNQPQDVILKWFKERKKANTGAPLNEVKVVFLGDGEAGKSHCIARLLKGGDVLTPEETPNDSTPGIVITDQSYRIGDRDVQVHFWDFGGQEILHSMHRMFLTERTLYVILINARDDTQDDRARYWLHNVRSFADGAPVLLVLNKMDQNPNASVNETDLRSIYPGLTEVVKLSARFDDQEKFNGSFTEAMKRQIGKMDNLGFFFPASWTRAKQRLLGMTDNYIMGSDYALICEESGIADEGDLRRSLLNWFNDLGVSICYSRHIRLKDYVILRPNWITNAVYAILFNKHPDTSNGIISHDAIFEMIQPPGAGADPYRRTNSAERYTQAEIDYILGVTRKFRLSFQVDDAHEFIPMLCQRESLPIAAEYAADPDALEFRMTFDYLPSNVLHRLMVELRQDLDTSHVWRTGARFAQKSSGLSALVKTGGNELRIFVRGTKQTHRPNTYLCIIKDAIDHIVRDMNLAEPVNEVVYKLEGKIQAFDYDELVESLDHDETTRYSRAHKRRLKIEDILNQTCHQPNEARKRLVEDMMTVCGQMQANRQNRDAYEDDRNTYIRDLLRAKGYLVADQTFSGEAAGGKRAGELDLLILDKPDHPWTLCEAMNLSGKGQSQIEYWNAHLQKLLGCYDANGMPFLFLISYVDCGADKFGPIMSAYYEHLRFYSPGDYALQSAEYMAVDGERGERNQYIQTAQCTYDREGFLTTVYHIFVRMGS